MNEEARQLYTQMGGVEVDRNLEEWHDRYVKMQSRLVAPKEGTDPREHLDAVESTICKNKNILGTIALNARLASEVARMITRDDDSDLEYKGLKWIEKSKGDPETVEIMQGGSPMMVTFIGDDRERPDEQLWVRFKNEQEPRAVARKMLVKETEKRRDEAQGNKFVAVLQKD